MSMAELKNFATSTQTHVKKQATHSRRLLRKHHRTADLKATRYPNQGDPQETNTHGHKRRDVLLASTTGLLWSIEARKAEASKLGATVDRTWEKFGGGPSDLSFPDAFLGTWNVQSTLVKVETPLGENQALSSIQGFERARSELEQTMQYRLRFIENRRGQIVMDRVFNMAEMLSNYYGTSVNLTERMRWDRDDPNAMQLTLPGGMHVSTLVTRRSQKEQADQKRIETSEFMRMVMETSEDMASSIVLGSQCFTKYKWRSAQEADRVGGPGIVATQVVSEFPSPMSSGDILPSFQPVVIYTYKMQFQKC